MFIPRGQAASNLAGSSLLSNKGRSRKLSRIEAESKGKGEKQVSDFREPDPCSDGGLSEGSINLKQQYRAQ
jgi:hypothetical protein